MKKILAFLLVLVMALTSMVGCDVINGLLNGTEEGPTLEEAKTYLFSTYKDAATAIPGDYDLVAKVIIDGTSFAVTWTVDLDTITIKESSKANFWTVDLPDTNATEVAYVLTATITDAAGNKVEVKFNKTLPVIDSTGIVTEPEEGVAYKLFLEQVNLGFTLFATNKSQQNEKYIETTLDPKAAADYYVEKVDGGYKWYTTINGTKTYVLAQGIDNNGKVSKYIGFSTTDASVFTYVQEISTWQTTINGIKYGVGTYNAFETVCISEVTYFKPDNINVANGQFPLTFMTKTYAETLTPDERPVAGDPEANSTLTIKQAIDLGNTKIKDQYTTGKYYVTGTIKEIQSETYGNLVITDGTNDLLVYGTYDATGANRFDAMATKPAVGDTITVYGIIGMYNAPQMKNGWITSTGGSAPSTGVVDAPVAGTAYNFGIINTVAGPDVYYISGGMAATYYFATSSDVTAALAVYLEATEGGYYMYVMEGNVKSYINYVVSGTHVNSKYEATASTVFTFDATLKTVVTVIEGENYVLGTRNDKNYTTVGPVKASTEPFYCQFYTASESAVCEHANTTSTTVDATCTAKGSTTVVCSDCNKTVSVTEIDKVAHNYVEGACSVCGAAQPSANTQVADFDTFTLADGTADTSYKDRTNAAGWILNNGRCDEDFADVAYDQIIINGKTSAIGKLTSTTLSGGIKSLSFGYGYSFGETNGVSIKINIKDASGNVVATTDLVDTTLAQDTPETFTWVLDTPVTGDFVIEIINNCPTQSTSNKDRYSLWNLTWENA